ncbi:MAG: chromosome segregation protein SMC [Fimbriimonadales bacterium]
MASVLTRIRLNGFKTFAQRTEIALTGPLSAVVGPNGCGKSNLVDALVWALGEVNIRTLRATTPTEVLFNGSSTHKPMGLAEVALWFNNETRWLPLEVDEVQIVRRLYRSGEWECWINKTPARLKDVADLFAGTGLGRGGYAIVGQGEIEAFLNANPEERRKWLEEVAGVSLYRNRRRETLRDLEATRIHLQRIEDVLRELDRQREPLREQAERALVYRELQKQLHQLERQRIAYEWLLTHQNLQNLSTERESLRQQVIQIEQLIGDLERQSDQYGTQIGAMEAEMDTLRSVLQALLSGEERLTGQLSALNERERTLQELSHALADEQASLEEREQALLKTLEELETAYQNAHTQAEQMAPQIRHAQAEADALAQRRTELNRQYQSALWQQAEHAQNRQRLEALQAQIADHQSQQHALQSQLERASALDEQARQQEEHARAEVATAQASARSSEQALQHHQRTLQEAMRRHETLKTRIRALEASLMSGEGASPPVRALLQAVQRGELRGEFVPVGAVLTVPEPLQKAIGSALGGSVNELITPNEQDAQAGVEWLKRTQSGRLTFLPLDLLKPAPVSPLPKESTEGVIGVASELVQTEACYQPVVQHLLGRVLVMESLQHAVQLLRSLRRTGKPIAYSRFVTLEGEVLQVSGAISGGSSKQERHSLLNLRAELDRARQEAQQAEETVAEAERGLEQAQQTHQQHLQDLEGARTRLQEATQARIHAENERRLHERELQHHQHQLSHLQAEHARLAQSLQQEVPDPAPLQTALSEAESAHQAALQTLSDLKSRYDQARRESQSLQQRIHHERSQLEQVRARRHALATRTHTIETEYAQIAQQRQSLQAELEQTQARANATRQQLEVMRTQRQNLLEQSFQITDRIRTQRTELQAIIERERSVELQLARTEVRLADLQETWAQMAPDEPLPEPTEPLPDRPPVARSEIEKLRRALNEMGEVNLGATEEYTRLTERYESLQHQQSDLVATCQQLEQNLREIDQRAREQFLETYQAVRRAFQARFTRLFEGGSADLILDNERDPLSAGVIVEAQPRGKRRQRLELLSGGERALTALALLFAFSDVRPTPILILDEVDAALDGRNVQRFADHLKEMAQHSQILIVTHNPITSAVADEWLGISMTGGVTRVVPYVPRLNGSDGNNADLSHAVVLRESESGIRP